MKKEEVKKMKKKIVISMMISVMLLNMTACAGGDMSKKEGAESDNMSKAEVLFTEDNGAEAEETGARYQAEWTKDAVVYEVNIRQYTEEGTFAAFGEHLQELKDMGITTLWFMPIHPISETKRAGTLGSYYAVADYRNVNPEFGTEEEFAALIEQAHDMGFKIMLDWVANHTGWDNAWITEHPEWYTQDEQGNIISPEGMGWPDVADLNYDNQEMRKEMIDCMKYWVEEYDVDGFRCDYATGVPQDFWEDARAELEKIKQVYMLAEDQLMPSLLEKAFDFNYNMELYECMVQVAKDAKPASRLKVYISDDLPDGTYTMNFMDNHDKNSYERTIMDAYGADAMPAMFSFLYTIPGVPLIYTGDEIGLDHAIKFMEKDTINWNSSEYDYRELLGELGNIRSNNPALYCGNYGGDIQYYEIENDNVLTFYREKDGNCVKCILNLSKREQTLDVSEIVDGTETVLLHGVSSGEFDMEDHPITEEKLSGEVALQPWEFWILSK